MNVQVSPKERIRGMLAPAYASLKNIAVVDGEV